MLCLTYLNFSSSFFPSPVASWDFWNGNALCLSLLLNEKYSKRTLVSKTFPCRGLDCATKENLPMHAALSYPTKWQPSTLLIFLGTVKPKAVSVVRLHSVSAGNDFCDCGLIQDISTTKSTKYKITIHHVTDIFWQRSPVASRSYCNLSKFHHTTLSAPWAAGSRRSRAVHQQFYGFCDVTGPAREEKISWGLRIKQCPWSHCQKNMLNTKAGEV